MVKELTYKKTSNLAFKINNFGFKMLVVLIQWTFLNGVIGFNVAPKATYLASINDHQQSSNSYFGYSVGLLRNKNGRNWLLVGAPLANSSGSPSIKQPGALFKCLIDKPERKCQEIYLDKSKNFEPEGLRYRIPFRDRAWTGAALDIDNDGNVMVCAPRWKNDFYSGEYRLTGTCYLIGQDLKNISAEIVNPLIQNRNQIYETSRDLVYYYAHGQNGMSVHFTNSSEFLLGSPGVLNWQGSVARLSRPLNLPLGGNSRRRRKPSFIYSSKFIPNPYQTFEIKDSYFFGYSVTSGRFSPINRTYYVAGAPRGASGFGMVLVFLMGKFEHSPLNIRESRQGTQLGEYFGASVAAPDLNGDGLSDLVVGAPLHSTEELYDIGCVYVFINSIRKAGKLEVDGTKLLGDVSQRARFGLALGSPGDLDKDGYEDLLVGAPYENDDLGDGPSGAVYVFMGTKNGVRETYLQKLVPQKVSPIPTIRGFGVSFSRPLDVDKNSYPDFAVGSFLSDNVVLMSTRPVIIARGELSSSPSKLSLAKTFFNLTACLVFEGETFKEIEFVVRIFISQKSKSEEMLVSFSDTGSAERIEHFSVPNNVKKCAENKVNLKLEKSDARNPVIVRMDFELKDQGNEGPETPVISPYTSFPPDLVLSFITGCKNDFCRSDLESTARIKDFDMNSKILIGKISKITVEIDTLNKGDPAFLPNVTITIPKPIKVLPSIRDCATEHDLHATVLVCQLKNPLKYYKKDNITLDLELSRLDDSSPDLRINVHSKSAADVEENPNNNNFTLKVAVEKNASIALVGYSEPDEVIYDMIKEGMIKTNQTFSIKYIASIAKLGFTSVRNVEVEILIPHNVTLPTRAKIALIQELEFKVFHSKPYVCTLYEPNLKNSRMLESMTTSTDSVFDERNSNSNDSNSNDVSLSTISCLSSHINCSMIKCSLGPMEKSNDVAQLEVTFKVNSTNLGSITFLPVDEGFTLISSVEVHIVTYKGVIPVSGQRSHAAAIQTIFVPGSLSAQPLSWWIYLVAVLCGLLVLFIIAYILYKVGFFKRKVKEELKAQKATLLQREDEKQ